MIHTQCASLNLAVRREQHLLKAKTDMLSVLFHPYSSCFYVFLASTIFSQQLVARQTPGRFTKWKQISAESSSLLEFYVWVVF